MNQKSITFRCSSSQHIRLHNTLSTLRCSRSELISDALESFLSYAEQDCIRRKNLFDLVDDIDAHGPGPRFADQA